MVLVITAVYLIILINISSSPDQWANAKVQQCNVSPEQ